MELPSTPIISADGHVNEGDDFWQRIPEPFRARATPSFESVEGDRIQGELFGMRIAFPRRAEEPTDDDGLSARELACEWRRDPTNGSDLSARLGLQARDGVCAEVVFPNLLLAVGYQPDAELNLAVSRTYNDWVHEVFSPMPERYVAVGMVPVDDLVLAVEEVERLARRGFRSIMLPCSYPWRPYDRADYDPLWRLCEETGLVVNFHVFTGNLGVAADFADVEGMDVESFGRHIERASDPGHRIERLSNTVIGMAAGMGPIVHLTGGGALERHPDLRFVVTEAECGWLAWTLEAMDAMQRRREVNFLEKLPERASDYFRRQGAVTLTDDRVALNNLEFTGADCLLWGNDYPHDEGTYPESASFIAEIRKRTTPEQADAILAGNAARVYGFDLEKLAGGAKALEGTRPAAASSP